MSTDIIYLSNVRLSFPHLTEPQENVNSVTGAKRISYNCEFLMPESHSGFIQFMKRFAELANVTWQEHANTVMAMINQDRKSRCYGRGEEKVNKKTFVPYDGYAGNVFITAGRDTQPQIIQADGTPIDPTNTLAYQQLTRKMYGGCRVNAAIKPWIQKNQHGNGIRCDLIAVQFAGDDKSFGKGETDASGMFGQAAAPAAPQPSVPGVGMPPSPFGASAPSPGLPPFMTGN